ncbi:DegT/DnrJ/EryC1/StrS family aminotransferase [Aeromicrobium yanjiei]|uniref:DegT/DnrJ/EryC1/StrS family aminotransferase n=1 Tax=Aeromicrobium yanjiei TaxID=2662028 RepID=UPI001F47C3B3|nr:DegT/DnrJ/EryC1/StrS family aminotransferase [Aeromicrobium yanjiei]
MNAANLEVGREIREAIDGVIGRGWYVLGQEVEAFENEFAAHVGAKYCVGVGNGLDALSLALRAHGIGRGDEVIVPTNTFIATWLAVSHLGAIPVPVEPDPSSMNIDPLAVEAAITPRTRAICPVHLYGLPADIPSIEAIAGPRGIAVIEDAAQAHGASLGGASVGSLGNTATWSFYPGKNLGAMGDGGAVTTDDVEVANSLRSLRNYGSSQKYVHEVPGVNSRLDELQAAVLRVKLRRLSTGNRRRREIANQYVEEMSALDVVLPRVVSGVDSSWHLFVVRSKERDSLQEALKRREVASLIHYPIPPHLQGAYAEEFRRGQFPIAEQLSSEVLSLPIGPHLRPIEAKRVVHAMREACSRTTDLPTT